MGSEWLSKIGDVADVYDGPHATPKKIENGPYFLSISSLDAGKLDLTKSAHLSEEQFIKWTKRVTPEEGDVLFSYETRLGEAALMPGGVKACLGRRMGLLRPDRSKVFPEYLLYAFLAPDFQQEIKSRTIHGATVDRIALKELPDFNIRLPSLNEQKQTVSVLSAIDQKIQLNRETNQTLEAMAQALFKSWFVDFDPVFDNIIAHNLAHNNAPLDNIPEPLLPHAQRRLNAQNVGRGSARQTAAHAFHHLFPQAFEQSDEPSVGIQGWVPKGWGVEKIGDVIENVGGGTPKTKEDDYWINGTHAFCTPKDMSSLSTKVLLKTERHLTDLGVSKVSSGVLDVGTVLMSSRAPIGYLAIAKTPTTVNQGIIAMKPNGKYSSEYILCWAEINQEEVVARANGSTFLEISKKNFREIPFVEPTDECTKQFGILAKEYFDRIEILSKENKQLESLRDTLLPKLISGELRIPEAVQASEALAK